MIGAQLMAKAIKRQEVRTVFGLPGHLEIFFGALLDEDIRLIHMRHEAAVVMAADGYARARRTIGIACVTAGPGLANALGGIMSAHAACTPLLVIAGRNSTKLDETASLQDMDHVRVVQPMTKWAQTVHDASRLGEYVDMACRVALSGRPGPVLLEVPRDVVQARVNEEQAAAALGPLIRPTRPQADPRAIRAAADLLSEAEHPIVIAGNGACWGDAGPGLRRLAGEFGIPVITRALGRGLVGEDMVTGFPWPLAYPAAQQADVVLLVGSRMGSPICYAAPPFFDAGARFIQIDIEGAEIGRNNAVEVPIVGDAGSAVTELACELTRRGFHPRDPAWVRAALNAKLTRLDQVGREQTGMAHPLQMARELARRMPADAIFVGDGANCLSWFKGALRVQRAPGWMDHEPFGSMGVGLPMAIGACAAQQEDGAGRAVCLGTGDGALGQYIAELSTAALHRLPIFVMVANDGGWGASRNIELRLMNRTHGVDLNQSRYDLVAKGLDCHGESVASVAELSPAFDRAWEAVGRGQPALVNVLVDRNSGLARGEPLLQMAPFNLDYRASR